jgi:hypothetical protein
MTTVHRNRLVAISLVSLTLTVATPLDVYLHNIDDLNFALMDFLPTSLVLLAGGFGLLVGLERLLRRFVGELRGYVLISCLFYLLWLQANLLQWPYGSLEEGDWYGHWRYGVIDSAIWIAVLSLGFGFSKVLASLLPAMNRWALLILAVSSAVSFVKVPYWKDSYTLSETSLFELSAKKNVLVFVLDQTQSDVFLELAREDEFSEAFRGFSFFADYMSNAQNTSLSIPMSLIGDYYDNSMPYGDFVQGGMKKASLPRRLKDAGFRSDLYFRPFFAFPNRWIDPSFVSNVTAVGYRLGPSAQINDLSLFVSLPHFARRLVYDDKNWLLQHKVPSLASYGVRGMRRLLRPTIASARGRENPSDISQRFADDDTKFTVAFTESTSLSSSQPTFKFYHWVGAHPPLRMTDTGDPLPRSNWGAGGTYRQKLRYKMRLLVRVFDRLKKLNIYDHSLIVIMGDHGHGLREDTREIRNPYTNEVRSHTYETSRANALFMLKDFGSDQSLQVLNQPLESLDINDLVYRRVRGESLAAILEQFPPQRVRRFVNYSVKFDDHYVVTELRPYADPFRELLVIGPVWRPESFLPLHTHSPGESPDCPFANYRRMRYWGNLAGTDHFQLIDNETVQVIPPVDVGSEGNWLALVKLQLTDRSDRHSVSMATAESILRSIRLESAVTGARHVVRPEYDLIEIHGRGTGQVRLIDAAGRFQSRIMPTGVHFFEIAH